MQLSDQQTKSHSNEETRQENRASMSARNPTNEHSPRNVSTTLQDCNMSLPDFYHLCPLDLATELEWAAMNSDLSAPARHVIHVICKVMSRGGDFCTPSLQFIIRATGMSNNTVLKAKTELAEWGYLRIITRRGRGGNVYQPIFTKPEIVAKLQQKLAKTKNQQAVFVINAYLKRLENEELDIINTCRSEPINGKNGCKSEPINFGTDDERSVSRLRNRCRSAPQQKRIHTESPSPVETHHFQSESSASPPNPPQGGGTDFWRGHLNPGATDDNPENALYFENGEIILSDVERRKWLPFFANDQDLDLALVEVVNRIRPNSNRSMVVQVRGVLSNMARNRQDQDRRYKAACERNQYRRKEPPKTTMEMLDALSTRRD